MNGISMKALLDVLAALGAARQKLGDDPASEAVALQVCAAEGALRSELKHAVPTIPLRSAA